MRSWLDISDYITILEDGKILIDPEKLAIHYESIMNQSASIKEERRIKKKIHDKFERVKVRCYGKTCRRNISYKRKGIQICQDWRYNFDNFYKWVIDNGYVDGMEIDRIDNNGNYCPNNCRLLTKKDHRLKSDRETAERHQLNRSRH